MSTTRATLTPVPMSLDHRIERVRAQLAELATYRGKGSPTRSLQEFDQETEALIAEQLGDGSELLEAYAYAEFGGGRRLGEYDRRSPGKCRFRQHPSPSCAARSRLGKLHCRARSAARS